MLCPNVKTEPDREDGKLVFKKRQHKIMGKGVVTCTKCNKSWCCMECAVECDALDHHYFDVIYEREGKCPAVYEIICCQCSGNKPSWTDRD